MTQALATAAPEHCLNSTSLADNSIEVSCDMDEVLWDEDMDEDKNVVQSGGETMFPSIACQIEGCWPLSNGTIIHIIFIGVCFNNKIHHHSCVCPPS